MLDKIKADRAAEALRIQKAKEEAERLKKAALASDEEEGEEAEKEKSEAADAEGAVDPEEAKPEQAEPPKASERPFTPEEAEELKTAVGDSDDEFELIQIKEKVKEFQAANGSTRIPPHLINEAVRWRLNRNDCQNRGYVLDGYPKNAQSA